MEQNVLKREAGRLSADVIGRLLAAAIVVLEVAWISTLLWGAVVVGRWLLD